MKLGYARISTSDQNASMQVQALLDAGVQKKYIFTDQMSGARTARERPEMTKLLEYAREGDAIYVWRIDRLGRSLVDVVNTVQDITDRGIRLYSIMDGVDPSTSHGRLQLALFASLAQYEGELINERVRAGVMAAQALGVKFGKQGPKQSTIETKIRLVRQLPARRNRPTHAPWQYDNGACHGWVRVVEAGGAGRTGHQIGRRSSRAAGIASAGATGGLRLQPWMLKDLRRLYINLPDGAKVGYLDLASMAAVPDTPASLDHLIIGPTGINAVNTKTSAYGMTEKGDVAYADGYRQTWIKSLNRDDGLADEYLASAARMELSVQQLVAVRSTIKVASSSPPLLAGEDHCAVITGAGPVFPAIQGRKSCHFMCAACPLFSSSSWTVGKFLLRGYDRLGWTPCLAAKWAKRSTSFSSERDFLWQMSTTRSRSSTERAFTGVH